MQSTTSKVVLLVVLAAAAIGLFVVLDGSDSTPTTTTETQGTTASTGTAPAAPTASIAVKNGAPAGGVAEIEAVRGDEVTIEVSSDAAGEVHVHGYEIEKPVEAGGTVRVKFTADLDGKFEIELHFEAGEPDEVEIAALTVQPS